MIAMMLDEIAQVLGSRSSAPVPPIRVTGVSTDSRTIQAGDLFFAIAGDRFDGHKFVGDVVRKGAVGCVVSHEPEGAEPSGLLRVPGTVEALGRLAAFHRRHAKAQVVAVTGSNGKTTTKCMIEHVLGSRFRGRGSIKSFNNHIGLPLTLLSAEQGDEFLVVEIGSNAPGEVAALGRLACPDIGVVTSIGYAHVGRLGGLAGVRAEKLSLFETVRDSGLCVAPLDDLGPSGLARAQDTRNRITFGLSEEADVRVTEVSGDLDGVRFKLNGRHEVRLPFPGVHNAMNVAAAFAVCRRFRMEPEEIVACLATFRAPDMRLTLRRLGGITLIDDSYNANPTSMAAAVHTLGGVHAGRRVFVAGDMLELGDESPQWHRTLGRQLSESGIEFIVGVGPQAEQVIRGASEKGAGIESVCYPDTDRAREDLPRRLRPGDTVLVKGSRAVGLDRLVRAIWEVHGPAQ